MGPKSKASKSSGWEECNSCHCLLASNDVEKHVVVCSRQGNGGQRTPRDIHQDFAKGYGFVKNDIIHGLVKERQIKAEELCKLPTNICDVIVVLSASAMALCKIPIGSSVLLWTSPVQFIMMTAWPSKGCSSLLDICLSRSVLERLQCKSGDVVHVQKYAPRVLKQAAQLVLQAIKEKAFYQSPDFLDFFLYHHDGKLVTVGQTLFFSFYGHECEFKVSQITDDEASAGFCKAMSNLRVHESTSGEQRQSTSSKNSESCTLCQCEKSIPKLDTCSYYVHRETKVKVGDEDRTKDEEADLLEKTIKPVTFEDIGGLEKQIKEIQLFLQIPVSGQRLFSDYGLQPPRGMVLFGPTGTGKSMIGQAIATMLKTSFVAINGPELYSKFYGETESRLQEIFEEAKRKAPSVIFIDEIDSLCPKRDGSSTPQEQRVMATLLTLMDSLPTGSSTRVLVVAATNKIDALDSAMRRPGRLDREVEIGIPTPGDREDILRRLMQHMRHGISDAQIAEIASSTHGYVGADLAALCAQAGLNALKRICPLDAPQLPDVSCDSAEVIYGDIVMAVKQIRPSALREMLVEVPKVRWEDIGGQEELKQKLKQAIEWPLRHPEVFQRMGISSPKGVLMYGPPGCSKTLIAKALATESGLNFIAIKGPELFSKWVGDSERAIRELFRKARSVAPSIVFFDEIDALAAERGSSSGSSQVSDRVLAQLLTEMDGLENLKGVTVVASTNRPDMIDKALLRPGRLDRIVYVPLPDAKTRSEIFDIQFRKTPVDADVHRGILVERTEGYSGAEIVSVCQEAALKAMEDSLEATSVNMSQFEHALKTVLPRISKESIQFYKNYAMQTNK